MKYFIEKKVGKNAFQTVDTCDTLEEAREVIQHNPELSIRFGVNALAAENVRRGFPYSTALEAAQKSAHKII